MKFRKIGIILIILFVLSIPSWFIYTRFLLPQYVMSGNTLNFRNAIYVRSDSISASDEENLGSTIGIGVKGKRKLDDFIWPFWIKEYKNDKQFNTLYISGLKGSGGIYRNISK